jgi:exopolysaccharide biosynthesis polyprenyl glycosylphosphotransferase
MAGPQDIRARAAGLPRSLIALGNYGRRLMRVASLLAVDWLAIYLAVGTAIALRGWIGGTYASDLAAQRTVEFGPLAYLVIILLFAKSHLYGAREVRPGASRVIATIFQVAIATGVYIIYRGHTLTGYSLFLVSLAIVAVYVSGLRFIYDELTGRLLRTLGIRRRAVLVGSGKQIEALAHTMGGDADTGYETIGFIPTSPSSDNGLRNLGHLSDLPRLIEEHSVEEVIIADADFPQERAVELIDECHQHGVAVRVAPSTLELLVHRAEFVPGSGVPLFEVKSPVIEGFNWLLKRAFDFVGAGLLLLVLSPLLLLIALLIRITSPGPAIYRSRRPGIGGMPFNCLKFRTMYHDAEHRQADLEEMNEADGAIFKIREDPRLTPVGRLLRRFSLDELPQLFNVLTGGMSLVGPRPLPMRDYKRLDEWHRRRYLVLPGITGLWQVSGRSDLGFDELVRLDFLYIESWSVFQDLAILLKTVPAVIRRRGAY